MIFKHTQEKNIKKLPQILLNDEFDNYAKTLGKNYNNIENLLASKSLAEFKTNNIQEPIHKSPNNSTSSNSVDSTNNNNNNTNHTTMIKSKLVKEKSFYFDEIDQKTPVNNNQNNVHNLEMEVKHITKETGNY